MDLSQDHRSLPLTVIAKKMTAIPINANDTLEMVRQMQEVLGGRIRDRWGEFVLEVSGELANGSIRLINFDWGVSLLDFRITFYEEIHLILDTPDHRPLHFVYCLEGYCRHKFDREPDEQIKTMEQYQSVILTGREPGRSCWYFPADVPLEISVIQIIRRKFLKKRLNGVEQLNQKLHEVFHDLDFENTYAYFGAYDLHMAGEVGKIMDIQVDGMTQAMKVEGLVYQLLSRHIHDHEKRAAAKKLPRGMLHREMKTIRALAKKIAKNPAKNYRLDTLSRETGLPQAKLQTGFKLLYHRTVTEYIRHIRLESARNLLRESDMNISQVVYSVGFSSRSYFSKIFRAKYGMSPSAFKEKAARVVKTEASGPSI